MDIIDLIDKGIKYGHNRYNKYRYKTDIIDIIYIGIKYRQNRYNRYRYKI